MFFFPFFLSAHDFPSKSDYYQASREYKLLFFSFFWALVLAWAFYSSIAIRVLPWKIALNLKISHVTRRRINLLLSSLWLFLLLFLIVFFQESPSSVQLTCAVFATAWHATSSSCTLHVILLTVSSFPPFSRGIFPPRRHSVCFCFCRLSWFFSSVDLI